MTADVVPARVAALDEREVTSLVLSRIVRRRIELRGVVQGVGLRPYVYVLASGMGLAGFVGNDDASAFIEVEGPEDAIDLFQSRLVASPPRLARLHQVVTDTLEPTGATEFAIAESVHTGGHTRTLVPPDIATCDDCLAELFDPTDRRFGYPFINCTNCGPRFTIIRDLPYDRPATTMAGFPLCAACEAEYRDPTDRRFHAQPVACAVCGPRLRVVVPNTANAVDPTGDQVAAACDLLAAGRVVAVKGIGGFHLACDASNPTAVETLRRRKQRGPKPFAVMAADRSVIEQFAHVDEHEWELLRSPERPIVLLRARAGATIPLLAAPGNGRIGVMLPYSPLHHLLLRRGTLPVLVMTSGNRADEPIVIDDDVAQRELGDLADAFVLHDRPINVPCDDSAVVVHDGRELPIRRSRGYAPMPVRLPFAVPPLLAVGGEMKTTFCLARDGNAWLSQHLGDMGNLATLRAFEGSVEQFQAMYDVAPQALAADLHPGYMTGRWAVERSARDGSTLHRVQHHHAHVASLMAEHGLPQGARVLGIAFDGTGYGTDGAIWGGEALLAGYASFARVAHLSSVPLPGGDAAIRHPDRVALAHLHAAGLAWDGDLAPVRSVDPIGLGVLARQMETGFRCTPTSSMGRLFDAVSALLGVRGTAEYEAQAAIEMEAVARGWSTGAGQMLCALNFGLRSPVDGSSYEWDPAPVLLGIVRAIRGGLPTAAIAHAFHVAVADAIGQLVSALTNSGVAFDAVGLTGGVFQNELLLTLAEERLEPLGVRVLTHRVVPPNDGGLALGQVVVAAARSTVHHDHEGEPPTCA